jgi:hypothetical protein
MPRPIKHGNAVRGKMTKTYQAWVSMRARCNDPHTKGFHNYGGRGISACERWNDFANFLADMGEVPPGLTLDRINNDLGYFPENCRWATYKEQIHNRRPKRLKMTPEQARAIQADPRLPHQIAADYGIGRSTVQRIIKGTGGRRLPRR